jgi:hypothetical protein
MQGLKNLDRRTRWESFRKRSSLEALKDPECQLFHSDFIDAVALAELQSRAHQ